MTQPPDPADYPPPAPDQGGFSPAPGGYPPPPPPPPGAYPPPPSPPPGAYPPPPGWGTPPPGSYPPPPGSYPPPPGGYPPPPGAYPPPPGAYPPPGSYPPPGNYPPPPPAEGGFAPPPPGLNHYSVGEAFSWAWNKFSKNAVPLLVGALIINLVLIVLASVFVVALQAVSPETFTAIDTGDGVIETSTTTLSGTGVAVLIIGFLAMLVFGGAALSAYIGGALDIADGKPVTIGSFLRPRNVIPMVLATLIAGIATGVGLVLCIIPGLFVMIFTLLYPVAIVDKNLSAVEGLRAGIDIAKRNFGQVALAWLISALIIAIGSSCLVLTVLSWPLAYLFLVYTYRKLSGESVAPATV